MDEMSQFQIAPEHQHISDKYAGKELKMRLEGKTVKCRIYARYRKQAILGCKEKDVCVELDWDFIEHQMATFGELRF